MKVDGLIHPCVGHRMQIVKAIVSDAPGITMHNLATEMEAAGALVTREMRNRNYRTIDRAIKYGLVRSQLSHEIDLMGKRSPHVVRSMTMLFAVES